MGRRILAIIGGLIAGFITITLMHKLGQLVYPLPEGVDMNNMESMKAYVKIAPIGALLMAILAHASGSLMGGLIATAIDGKKEFAPAVIIGFATLVLGLVNLMMLPSPFWFIVLDVLLYIPASMVGASILIKKFR